MKYIQVNPNASYASVAAGNFISKNISLLPPLLSKNYTFVSPYRQCFSFPYDMMKFILNNPRSPNELLKLYQTCKYFYLKREILVVTGKFIALTYKHLHYQLINKNNLKNVKKAYLWFDGAVLIHDNYFFDLTKVYRSTVKHLAINNTNLTFNEFKLLVAEETVEEFFLDRSANITNVDGKRLAIDAILQLLPNVKKLTYLNWKEEYSAETCKKMIALKMNNKLELLFLRLNQIPEDFDSDLLFQFILKNSALGCDITFYPTGDDELGTSLKIFHAAKKFNFKIKIV